MTSSVVVSRCVALIGFIASAAAFAEPPGVWPDPAPPSLTATTSWHANATLGDGPGSVRTREYGLELGLYRIERADAVLDIGVDYQYTHFALDGIDSRNRDVHRLRFPLRFAAMHGKQQVRGYVAPGIATSSNVFKDFFNRGSGDDLTVAGRIEIYSTDAARPWTAGVAYDQSFGRPLFYPVIGVDMFPDEALRVRIAFPDSGLWFRASDRHAFSARLFPSGERWRVVTDDFRSDFDLRREEWRAQLTWSVTLGGIVTLDLAAGHAFERRMVLTDRTGGRIDSAFDEGLFAEAGIRLGRPPAAP